jgi:hypothetical protein
MNEVSNPGPGNLPREERESPPEGRRFMGYTLSSHHLPAYPGARAIAKKKMRFPHDSEREPSRALASGLPLVSILVFRKRKTAPWPADLKVYGIAATLFI